MVDRKSIAAWLPIARGIALDNKSSRSMVDAAIIALRHAAHLPDVREVLDLLDKRREKAWFHKGPSKQKAATGKRSSKNPRK